MISPTPTSSTRRVLARPRPSITTNTQPTSPVPPALTSPMLSPASMLARKASFQQLTQNSLASVPDGSADYALSGPRGRLDYGTKKSINGGDIEVGDVVDTPGGMHGVVKFIGSVRGKNGLFCGVELEGSLSGKGKNDGVVDGVRYFATSSPMSGIFVPLSRATKRLSASSSNAPPTPPLSSHSALTANSTRRSDSPGPRTLGGSLGRPTGGRPSLSRPESPIRRHAGAAPRLLPPTTPRHVSAAGPSRLLAPSPTPGKGRGERGRSGSVSINQEPETRPGTSGGASRITPVPKQMGAQLGVRKGMHSFGIRSTSAMDRQPVDDDIASPIDTNVPEIPMALRRNEDGGAAAALVVELERKLADRERQLDEQTASMNEMESTLIELQSLIESAQHTANSPQMMGLQRNMRDIEDADASQLRALLREKNDKIAQLNQEFDSHRADFRSTIDTLELASSETVRVYEQRVEDLLQQNRELMERGEDVESVARQLKQLEELVAELEEGLEDARRGEAEARGEVEFLRGEVERSREELRREKEKSAAAVANAAVGSMMRNNNAELEKKDEEIRGLKAIIHSLSRDTVSDDEHEPVEAKTTNGHPPLTNGHGDSESEVRNSDEEELAKEREIREKLEQRIAELEAQVKVKEERESQLEREIELLERDRRNSVISERPAKTNSVYSVASEKAFQELTKPLNKVTIDTNTGGSIVKDTARESKGSVASWRSAHEESKLAATKNPSVDGDPNLWCEMCEASGHDILTCTSMFGSSGGRPAIEGAEAKPDTTASTPIDTEGDVVPLSVESSSPIDAPEELPMSPASAKKKSVHLPLPPPMIDSSFGPVAGKESGIVDHNKWCGVCERDGHGSIDCPFEDAF